MLRYSLRRGADCQSALQVFARHAGKFEDGIRSVRAAGGLEAGFQIFGEDAPGDGGGCQHGELIAFGDALF